jgi:hypothetical protein
MLIHIRTWSGEKSGVREKSGNFIIEIWYTPWSKAIFKMIFEKKNFSKKFQIWYIFVPMGTNALMKTRITVPIFRHEEH